MKINQSKSIENKKLAQDKIVKRACGNSVALYAKLII
jgi:hypothetical protein